MTQDERMITRLTPPAATLRPDEAGNVASGRAPGFLIEIPAADGAMLLRLREEKGMLVIEGDESRWDEGAKRFLHQMMQWSGVVGLRWKDEVKATVQ